MTSPFSSKRSELADHGIDWRARFHHHHGDPRFFERPDKFLQRASRLNVFSFGASRGEFFRHFRRAIKHGNRKTLGFHVQDEILAHDPQTDQANITLIRVHFGISFCGCSIEKEHFSEQSHLMANVVCEISVTEAPLTGAENDVAEAGAIVDFWV